MGREAIRERTTKDRKQKFSTGRKWEKKERVQGRPVGSVGRVPDYHAGGRGFKPRPDHHLGPSNN